MDHWTVSWNRILLKKLIVTQLIMTFLAFHGIQMFISMFTKPATVPYPVSYASSPHLPTLQVFSPQRESNPSGYTDKHVPAPLHGFKTQISTSQPLILQFYAGTC